MELDFQQWLRKQGDRTVAAEDDESGEQFFAEIEKETLVETSGWAQELAERVAARVQAGDPPEQRKQPVVYWSEKRTAFAVPGRRIYLSRRLLEEKLPEDAVAFIFAHELGHHRLGHLTTVLPALKNSAHRTGARVATFATLFASRFLMKRENEAAADAWALERCLAVGYDGHECLKTFDVLRNIAENFRDLEGAFGEGSVDELAATDESSDEPEWKRTMNALAGRARRAASEISRGYPSLFDRRGALQKILDRRGT